MNLAAQQLGRLGKGKKHSLSVEQIKVLCERLAFARGIKQQKRAEQKAKEKNESNNNKTT
jgi:hypothetical protein